MFKFIKWGLLLVTALVFWNLFFGNPMEKERSKEILNQVGTVGKSLGAFVGDEYQKIREGKFDKVLSQLDKVFDRLDSASERLSNSDLEDLKLLKEEKEYLEKQLPNYSETMNSEDRKDFKKELEHVVKRTEQLMDILYPEEVESEN